MDVEEVLAVALEAAREERPIEELLSLLIRRDVSGAVVRDAAAVCSDRYGLASMDATRAHTLLEACLFSGALRP